MIQITILTTDGITAVRIADFLVEEKLVINAKLTEKIQQYNRSDTGILLESRFMVSAITKGLLFTVIEKRLKDTFPNMEIEFYAVPIVNMNWEQADKLVTNTEKV